MCLSLTVSSHARQLASGLCKHCENSPCTSTRGCLASLMALTETHRLQLHKGKPTTACLPSADLAFEEMFLRANSRNLFVCNRLKALCFPRGYYNNNNVSLAVLYMLFYQFVLLPFILNVIPLLEIPDMNFWAFTILSPQFLFSILIDNSTETIISRLTENELPTILIVTKMHTLPNFSFSNVRICCFSLSYDG